MIKKYLQTLSLTIVCCCMFITAASARVCFLPDEKNCGLASNLNLPESTNTVIPCEFKTCEDTNLNTDLEICDHVGTCYYKKCKLTQSKCEKQRKNNQECLLDITTGCYDLKEIETCPAIYTRDKNDIHGDCKECVDKKGSHWYCQYDSCDALYAGSSKNPTCSEGVSTKYVGTSIQEGKCYVCDPNSDTSCSSYTDVEKDGSCWSCESCPADRNKFKCTENVREGYEIKNGVCQLSSQNKTTYTVYVNDRIISSGAGQGISETEFKRTVTSTSTAAIDVTTYGIEANIRWVCYSGDDRECNKDPEESETSISNGDKWKEYTYEDQAGYEHDEIYYSWNKMDISIDGTKYTVSDSLNRSSYPCVTGSVKHGNATYNIVCSE